MSEKRLNKSAKQIAFIALCSALLCVLAPISLPVGVIPISLATFALYLLALTTNVKTSVIAVFVYVFIGVCGLPVFSGYTGGIGKITGLTGGFILGYIPSSAVISGISKKFNGVFAGVLSCVMGTLIIYLTGTAQYAFLTKTDFLTAIKICVLPFAIIDVIKIALANVISYYVKKPIGKIIGK